MKSFKKVKETNYNHKCIFGKSIKVAQNRHRQWVFDIHSISCIPKRKNLEDSYWDFELANVQVFHFLSIYVENEYVKCHKQIEEHAKSIVVHENVAARICNGKSLLMNQEGNLGTLNTWRNWSK